MPTLSPTPIAGVDKRTKSEGISPRGHVSNVVDGRDGQSICAFLYADGTIAVNISGVGGSTTMLFDPATWDQIIAHVNAVREPAEVSA